MDAYPDLSSRQGLNGRHENSARLLAASGPCDSGVWSRGEQRRRSRVVVGDTGEELQGLKRMYSCNYLDERLTWKENGRSQIRGRSQDLKLLG